MTDEEEYTNDIKDFLKDGENIEEDVIDNVEEDIEEDSVFIRLQFLSNLLERFHNEGFYGYKETPASKILKETDATCAREGSPPFSGRLSLSQSLAPPAGRPDDSLL